MKTTSIAIAAAAFAAASAASAVESFGGESPSEGSLTRIEVQAEAQRAAVAGELAGGEPGIRFGDPASISVAQVDRIIQPLVGIDRGRRGREVDSDFAVGGM